MADSNFSAIRARLRYGSLDEFIDGYSRFITRGGMFIPMAPAKLKPVGTTIRFQFLLEDGTTAMLGEGVVRQINGPDDPGSTVGMLVKFTKLSPDTKSLVDRVLRDKDEQSTSVQETVDSDDNPTAPARQPVPADDDPSTSELSAGDLAVTSERDAVEEQSQDDQPTGSFDEDELFGAPDEGLPDADSAATREGESRDAIALSNTPEAADETEMDEGPGLSAGEVFSEAEEDSEVQDETELQEESEPEELELADLEEESDEPTPEPPEESEAEASDESGGPRELGRTEAGLQIMAFDEVTDEDAEEFANFALGGEEDDVDQMFAGIFGDDGDGADDFLDDAFGGGDSGDADAGEGDLFGGALGGDANADEDAVFGEAEGGAFGGANEDSFIADAEAKEQAAGEAEEDSFMLESEVERDLSVDEGISPMTNELHTEDIVDEELVEEDEAPELEAQLEDELELELEEESEVEPPEPSLEQPEPPAAAPEFESDAPEADEPEFDEPEPEFEPADDVNSALNELPDEDALLPNEHVEEDDSQEFLLDEEADDEADDDEQPLDRDALAAQLAGEEEPSEELINLLGSLEDSEVEDAEIQLQQLKDDIEEKKEEEDFDADDEESLESLLAVANAEIEAKHKKEEEEKKGEDILDDLLGDDLPPPPSEESQFDMPLPDEKEKKKKKKKKGFISKLFGKD